MDKELKGKKFVVLDDDELNLKLFYDLLMRIDAEVRPLSESDKIVDLIKNFLPDMVLMDIRLKDVSGHEIIKEIKENKDILHIPVIAVTALSMDEELSKIKISGFDDFIMKPFSMNQFYKIINKYLKPQNDS